jgi:hypothetical protein
VTSTRPEARPGRFATLRTDRWWVPVVRDATFLGVVLLYSLWASLQTSNYAVDNYISPIFSPCLTTSCGEHANLKLLGDWYTWSPALLVAAVPIVFRLTCYYYRKVYYRSYFLSPPACAVTEPRAKYKGEARFPLILTNIHRYLWVAAIPVVLILLYDGYHSLRFPDGWGLGVGSLLIIVNALLFAVYTLGCHSCRHILGGRLKNFSKHPLRYRYWTFVSKLNPKHGTYAMISLFTVILTDAYIMSLSAGWFSDLRFFN